MRRRDRRWDSEVRPVCCSTSLFRTRSYHRIPSSCLIHFWWKASRVLTSADSKVQVSAAYSNTDKTSLVYTELGVQCQALIINHHLALITLKPTLNRYHSPNLKTAIVTRWHNYYVCYGSYRGAGVEGGDVRGGGRCPDTTGSSTLAAECQVVKARVCACATTEQRGLLVVECFLAHAMSTGTCTAAFDSHYHSYINDQQHSNACRSVISLTADFFSLPTSDSTDSYQCCFF